MSAVTQNVLCWLSYRGLRSYNRLPQCKDCDLYVSFVILKGLQTSFHCTTWCCILINKTTLYFVPCKNKFWARSLYQTHSCVFVLFPMAYCVSCVSSGDPERPGGLWSPHHRTGDSGLVQSEQQASVWQALCWLETSVQGSQGKRGQCFKMDEGLNNFGLTTTPL